jgi:hypothetical protein
VDDALRDPLAVEVGHLLEELVVLERGRAALADRPLVLVVVDRMALAVGQDPAVVALGGPLAGLRRSWRERTERLGSHRGAAPQSNLATGRAIPALH